MTRAVSPARSWSGSALLLATVLLSTSSLGALVLPGAWRGVTALVVVLVALACAVARQLAPGRLAPTGWGLLVGVLAVWVTYAGDGPGPALTPPGPTALGDLARLADHGAQAVVGGIIPVEVGRDLELLLVSGAVLALLGADLLALGLGRAGLAGLPLVALWVPAAIFERLPGPVLSAAAAACFVALLAVVRPGPHTPGPPTREAPRIAVGAALVAVVAVAAGSLAPLSPGFGTARLPSIWGAPAGDGPLRVSTDLDMRADLGPRSERAVMSYTTTGDAPEVLRLSTVRTFDGAQWRALAEPTGDGPADGWLWPEGDVATTETDSRRLDITVAELDQENLPLPLEPRSLSPGGAWVYDTASDEVRAERPATRGLSYAVHVYPRDLGPDRLRQDSAGSVAPDSGLLDVPDTPFATAIRDLTADLTADAPTTYDQALALQTYFRDTTTFRYDTEVPAGATDDAVWDFLNDRTGYCVQYATAMTVMARTLGIPARMGVGFLPGRQRPGSAGEYVVTARQAHTWPELYFAEAGWVRFEPTPATQSGAPPVYADPQTAGPGEQPEAEPPMTEPSPAVPEPQGADTSTPGGAGSDGEPSPAGTTVAVPVLVVLVVILVAGMAWRRRARRTAPPLDEAEAAWLRLTTLAATHGISWDPATTPRQKGELLRRAMPPGHAGDEAVDHLVSALEAARYAPEPALPEESELAEWVAAVADGLHAATRTSVRTTNATL